MNADRTSDDASKPSDQNAPRSAARRRLLQGGAAAAPAILTFVSAPVRATYYTTPASSFASINTSRPKDTHSTSGCKPAWWCGYQVKYWPNSCRTNSTPKKFKEIFGDHSTYGEKTLKECMQLAYDTGTDGMAKHLCAAFLNAESMRTPSVICSSFMVKDIWNSYKFKGYFEPTAGVKWFCDSCEPSGNGGITPWLKTTMPAG